LEFKEFDEFPGGENNIRITSVLAAQQAKSRESCVNLYC